ncbi:MULTISPECIES: GNAT family N-acetyltransferase [Myroides]|uniref:GNAT family N-acetyltransferase n=1 Tax=Myroides albus TaxID=2562892 RepID=A0A6I3LGW2_9FLAO|nr:MULTISPECIES: GNAT family N-acetyltransferase [Myroides]MTG97077.1 GNAT family N-acetyltransferase [Myroides albus]MVX34802.1 GNAT family N-acetyltransferase [Myroides sp. LoEW2-1]UVD78500.1 GNAT family N-acetyltransferase [Myroides albus]
MKIETERLILRPWLESDAESLYLYAQDENVGPPAGWPAHKSVDESREIIKKEFAYPEIYAVALKETNEAIGCIGLLIGENSNFDISNHEAEVAYWVGVPHWGKGYIPEALKALIRHAFTSLKMTDLWCGFYEGNIKSLRAQAKCGFTFAYKSPNRYDKYFKDDRIEVVTRLKYEEWLQMESQM